MLAFLFCFFCATLVTLPCVFYSYPLFVCTIILVIRTFPSYELSCHLVIRLFRVLVTLAVYLISMLSCCVLLGPAQDLVLGHIMPSDAHACLSVRQQMWPPSSPDSGRRYFGNSRLESKGCRATPSFGGVTHCYGKPRGNWPGTTPHWTS